MTLHQFLLNLAAYSLQIAAIVAAGTALPFLFRIRRPGAMLMYRHALLAVCVMLPLLQPWQHPVIDSRSGVSVRTVSAAIPANPAPRRLSFDESIALLLAAGLLVRLAWLSIGLRRLRHLRRNSTPLSPANPAILLSAGVAGPVTFGVRNPVILLPLQFPAMSDGSRDAIVRHEMAHIRRRDWAFTMAEELVRALFWFHPAIWWLLGQIQLTREQAVDAEVIAATGSTGLYIEALLAVAGNRLQPDLAPAPSFLLRSHLPQRVAMILKGSTMSKRRLLTSFAAIAGALVLIARLAVLNFPISAPAQEIVKGEINLLHRTPVVYPADLIEKGIQGTVILEATLNERGVVTDARVLNGPEPLRGAALKSVLDWHYTGEAKSPVQIVIDFKLPLKAPAPVAIPVSRPAVPSSRRPAGPLRVTRIEFIGVSPQLREIIESRLPYRVGDELGPDTAGRLTQALADIDQHLVHSVEFNFQKGASEPDDAVIRISFRAPDAAPQRIRIGGNVQAEKAVSAPHPVYPPEAKLAGIQGLVKLSIVVGKDGTIQDIRAESGHPMLVPAALEAVRQWVYKPTLLNGNPVEVASIVDVNFTLAQ